MRLVVVAASGRVGRHVVAQAAEHGHDVLALARTPDRVPAPVVAHALDLGTTTPAALAALLRPDDVVVSCLGAARRGDVGIATAGTRLVLAATREAGVTRLVATSASPVAGMLPGAPDLGEDPVTRWLLNPVLRRVLRGAYADLVGMELVLRDSGAAWTVVRPPRLTDGPLSGRHRTAVDLALPRGRKVSRADLAHLLLRLAADPSAARQAVSVAY